MLKWKRIVVATDFSERAKAALETAARIAKISDGTVWVIHVADLAPPYVEPLLTRMGPADPDEVWLREARGEMASLLSDLRRRVPDARGFVRTGAPWRHVIELAGEADADGICLGVSGHSRIDRILMGATAEAMIRHSPVPVLVTRKEPLGAVHSVLLPTEMDEGSRSAIRYAAVRFGPGVRLEALHVVPSWPAFDPAAWGDLPTREEFEGLLREFLEGIEEADRVVGRVVLFADPAAAIVEVSREETPDLIVVSTHARRGVARTLLGSVSEKIVRYTDPPVLVLPGPKSVEEEREREQRRSRRPRTEEPEGEVEPLEARRPPRRAARPVSGDLPTR